MAEPKNVKTRINDVALPNPLDYEYEIEQGEFIPRIGCIDVEKEGPLSREELEHWCFDRDEDGNRNLWLKDVSCVDNAGVHMTEAREKQFYDMHSFMGDDGKLYIFDDIESLTEGDCNRFHEQHPDYNERKALAEKQQERSVKNMAKFQRTDLVNADEYISQNDGYVPRINVIDIERDGFPNSEELTDWCFNTCRGEINVHFRDVVFLNGEKSTVMTEAREKQFYDMHTFKDEGKLYVVEDVKSLDAHPDLKAKFYEQHPDYDTRRKELFDAYEKSMSDAYQKAMSVRRGKRKSIDRSAAVDSEFGGIAVEANNITSVPKFDD